MRPKILPTVIAHVGEGFTQGEGVHGEGVHKPCEECYRGDEAHRDHDEIQCGEVGENEESNLSSLLFCEFLY